MTDILLRKAVFADIRILTHLWLEKMTLIQQSDPAFKLLPDAFTQWSEALGKRIANSNVYILVGEIKGIIGGFCIGHIENNLDGLWPEKIGIVENLVLDLHLYHGGLGRRLISTMNKWFLDNNILQISIVIPHHFPPEQAFWLSLGVGLHYEIGWMRL